MRKIVGMCGIILCAIGCGTTGRENADEVDVKSVKHALVSSEGALAALGLDPTSSSIAFGASDTGGYDVFTTNAAGFPTQGDSYLVLSSGCTGLTLTENTSGSTSCQLGGLKTNAGQDLVQATVTTPVPAGAKCFLVDWRFFSEEYPEFVGTPYNDAFLVERDSSNFSVSGTTVTAPNNVAYDADGNLITINTTGVLGMTPANAAGTTYDGATTTLTTQAPIGSEQTDITVVLSVMDLGDSIYDSTVFVDHIRFSGSECGQPVTNPTPPNEPPIALCNDVVVSTDPGTCSASPSINAGSSDSDGNLAECTQTPANPLGLGSSSVTLLCTDSQGLSSSCTAQVTIRDDIPPEITCPTDQTLECSGGQSALQFEVSVTDNCSAAPASCTRPSGSSFSVGTSENQCTATDGSSNSASCTFNVTVSDTRAPTMVTINEPIVIWPPDHSYHEFSLSDCISQVTDACDGELLANASGRIVAIASDEAEDDKVGVGGPGDGNTCNDIVLTGKSTAQVRAERLGTSNGRVYRVSFEVSDAAGNVAPGSCVLVVPHDEGQGSNVVEDSCGYCVGESCGACPGHDATCTF